jgi:hypothetical protein
MTGGDDDYGDAFKEARGRLLESNFSSAIARSIASNKAKRTERDQPKSNIVDVARAAAGR